MDVEDERTGFFRARRVEMFAMKHPLAVLATRILWSHLESSLTSCFVLPDRYGQSCEVSDLGTSLQIAGSGVSVAGRPRLSMRLMLSLLYLKQASDLSDEELVRPDY